MALGESDPRSAAAIMEEHDCDVFQRVGSLGYALFFAIDGAAPSREMRIQVRVGDEQVATARFREQDTSEPSAYCDNVWVIDEHQRCGLANAMYLLAEIVLGVPLVNVWKTLGQQSDAGRALWNQPNRPFGRRGGR
jgi:hypothetical protein